MHRPFRRCGRVVQRRGTCAVIVATTQRDHGHDAAIRTKVWRQDRPKNFRSEIDRVGDYGDQTRRLRAKTCRLETRIIRQRVRFVYASRYG